MQPLCSPSQITSLIVLVYTRPLVIIYTTLQFFRTNGHRSLDPLARTRPSTVPTMADPAGPEGEIAGFTPVSAGGGGPGVPCLWSRCFLDIIKDQHKHTQNTPPSYHVSTVSFPVCVAPTHAVSPNQPTRAHPSRVYPRPTPWRAYGANQGVKLGRRVLQPISPSICTIHVPGVHILGNTNPLASSCELVLTSRDPHPIASSRCCLSLCDIAVPFFGTRRSGWLSRELE